MAESPTILVRTRLTQDEWNYLRKGAVDKGQLTSEYVTAVIRAGMKALDRKGEK